MLKCHIDLLRIDEDDISHYVYVKKIVADF